MTWFPVGPEFVFAPKNNPFKRLSRRNEYGRQGLVTSITVDDGDPSTIYVCERPSSGGTSAFRTREDGRSWTCISDSLQQANPAVDPYVIAINPDHPETIYMATHWDGALYVSSDRGDTWGPRHAIGGSVRALVIDTRTSSNLATTVLYAGTTNGVYRSADGGATWSQVIAGNVLTLVAHTPSTGTAHFYAGMFGGAAYATDPSTAAGWLDLIAAGVGLPASNTFGAIMIDFCRRDPKRAYAWVLNPDTIGIYTTKAPKTSWTAIPAVSPPSPGYGYYALSFAVAPNSPGDGLNDILLFGNVSLSRSIDSGRTWTADGVWFHADQHSIAFVPQYSSSGVVPTTFVGNDGGLAKSSKFADPTVAIGMTPADYNEGDFTSDTAAWQNLDHGKQSSAVYQYATVKGYEALSYIGCQDTGVSGGDRSGCWRGLVDADGGQIAAVAGPSQVVVWGNLGQYNIWPTYILSRWLDTGNFAPASGFCQLGGSLMGPRSSLVVALDGTCLSGVVVRDSNTTLSSSIIGGPAAQVATPVSMTNIQVGSFLTIGDGTANAEDVAVTAVTATTFTATFAKDHASGDGVFPNRELIARIAQDGSAIQISQDFTPHGQVGTVVASPTNPDILYAGTNDSRVWFTMSGSTASPTTVWTEVSAARPANAQLRSMTLNNNNDAYVLLAQPITIGGVTSPLFKVSGGSWQIQPCLNLPAGSFGKLVSDPLDPATFYASVDSRVFRLILAGGSFTWADISTGLPGGPIYDLMACVHRSGASHKVLLRAAIPARGIFEVDVTPGATSPAIALYVRDNFLDTGWLNPSPDFVADPFNPGDWVTHYHCADIKIDARQNRPVHTATDFYQTDPEGDPIPPLNHVLFGQLEDNSENLPQMDQAWVHAQVQNRSTTPSGDVHVWAIYCNASAGVPALSASPSMGNAFPFWNQFGAGGTITPNLPSDSPWVSVGPPQTLTGIDVTHAKVASWNWSIPLLSTGDPGHYCMVVFVHSSAAPIGETTRMVVDQITPTNPQVGQKNLHLGPPLPPAPGPGGAPRMREYIEFHNPFAVDSVFTLEIDLRSLPKNLATSFLLTRIDTVQELQDSLVGVTSVTPIDIQSLGLHTVSESSGRLGCLAWLWCMIQNFVGSIFGRPSRDCANRRRVVELPDFVPQRYAAQSSTLVQVQGVRLPPFASGAILLDVETSGNLEAAETYRFDVRQRMQGDERKHPYVGGGTYVVQIGGKPKGYEPLFAPSHDPQTDDDKREEIERQGEDRRWVPLWAAELVEQRKNELPHVNE